MSPSATPSGPILAVDAASEPASAAVVSADARAFVKEAAPGERAGSALHGCIAAVLAEAGLQAAELAAVVAVSGPGSFTGLRVALAAAQGLSLATGRPGLSVETSEALVWADGGDGTFAVLLDGGHGRLFAALHERAGPALRRLRPIEDLAPAAALELLEELRPDAILVRGAGALSPELAALGARRCDGPLAEAAARLARQGLASASLEPVYAREPAIRPRPS